MSARFEVSPKAVGSLHGGRFLLPTLRPTDRRAGQSVSARRRLRPLCRQAVTAVSRIHRLYRLGFRASPSFAQRQRLFHRRAWSPTGGRIRPPGSQSLQVLQRFHSVKTAFYLCSVIQKCSCRSKDRTVVYGTADGGSNPLGSTNRDVVQRSSMPDSDSSDPGSTPGIPTKHRAVV